MTQTQTALHMKTYFSSTVEAAVELARRELGSEAMLVNSRPAPEDVRHLGRYEVIFATGGPPSGPSQVVKEPKYVEPFLPPNAYTSRGAIRKPPAMATGSDTQFQLDDIRGQLNTIRQSLWNPKGEGEASNAPSDSAMMRRMLEANGMEPSLARDLMHAVVQGNKTPMSRDQFRTALMAEMERRVETDPGLSKDPGTRAVVALVGPPGRGKSTTLVKIAIQEGLARRSAVRIISIDNYRVGASEQMRCFGAILGVSYQSCQTVAELDQQLGNTWGADIYKAGLTLIDTSGYSPADLEESAELAAYLSARREINVHLVLRADTKCADGMNTVQRYSHFGVSRLVFTGMDEAETFGSVYAIAAQSRLPVSFLGTGQRIPEDLEVAEQNRLVHLVMDGKESRVSAAA